MLLSPEVRAIRAGGSGCLRWLSICEATILREIRRDDEVFFSVSERWKRWSAALAMFPVGTNLGMFEHAEALIGFGDGALGMVHLAHGVSTGALGCCQIRSGCF